MLFRSIGMYAIAGFGIVTSVWQAMVVAFIAEASIALLIVIWYTMLQRLVPRHLLGRVSSLDWLISIAGVPLSFAIVGPVAEWIGADLTIIFAGLLGGSVTLAFMFVPGARDPERDGSLVGRADRAAKHCLGHLDPRVLAQLADDAVLKAFILAHKAAGQGRQPQTRTGLSLDQQHVPGLHHHGGDGDEGRRIG